MLFTCMAAPVPVLELLAQGHAELAQPHIMLETGTSPNGARVLRVLDREIAVLARI
jgi:hypothetical protein